MCSWCWQAVAVLRLALAQLLHPRGKRTSLGHIALAWQCHAGAEFLTPAAPEHKAL